MKRRLLALLLTAFLLVPLFAINASAAWNHNSIPTPDKFTSSGTVSDGAYTVSFSDSNGSSTGYVSKWGKQLYLMSENYWLSGERNQIIPGYQARSAITTNNPTTVTGEPFWVQTAAMGAMDNLVNGGAFCQAGITVPTMSIAFSIGAPAGDATVYNTDDTKGYAVNYGPIKDGIVFTLSSEGTVGNKNMGGYNIVCATVYYITFIYNGEIVYEKSEKLDPKTDPVYLSGQSETYGMSMYNEFTFSDDTGFEVSSGDNFGWTHNNFSVTPDEYPDIVDFISDCKDYYVSILAAAPLHVNHATNEAMSQDGWGATSFGIARLGNGDTQPVDFVPYGKDCVCEYYDNEDGTHTRVCEKHDDEEIIESCHYVAQDDGGKTVYVCKDCGSVFAPYNVAFGGDNIEDIDDQQLNYDEIPVMPEVPEVDGYDFLGFYIGDTDVLYNFGYPLNKNVTLTGKWQLKNHSVVFLFPDDVKQEFTYVHGSLMEKVEAPEIEGYRFDDFYHIDPDGAIICAVDWTLPVNQDYVILAKYDFINPFDDISEGEWYYDYVMALAARGIINGMTPTTFAPSQGLTRAQFVQMLYQIGFDESETVKDDNPFTDVKEDAWYYKAVVWAFNKGYAAGMTETTFQPNTVITREQAATFLYRFYFADEVGTDLSILDKFTDAKTIHEYAKIPVACLANKSIINGFPDKTFKPLKTITRAETAVMVYSAITYVESLV